MINHRLASRANGPRLLFGRLCRVGADEGLRFECPRSRTIRLKMPVGGSNLETLARHPFRLLLQVILRA